MNSAEYNKLFKEAGINKYKVEKFWETDNEGNSSILNFPQIESSIKNKNIVHHKLTMIKVNEQKLESEAFSQQSNDFYNETNNEIERSTSALLYLVKLLPYLNIFEYSESKSSDFLLDEGSSEEIGVLSKIDKGFSYESYGSRDSNLASTAQIDNRFGSSKLTLSSLRKEIQYMITYYLLSCSYKISGQVSYTIQKLFIENDESRTFILDQISYMIKQTQGSISTIGYSGVPKHLIVLYQHLNLLVGFWRDSELQIYGNRTSLEL